MSAVTQNSYIGNGSTTNYSFTFPYLKSTDVEVQVDATVTTAWQFANATTVQFNTAPANGAKIKILRQTNVDSLAATFYAGSAIKSEDLNDNYTQNLYKTQEVGARFFSNTGGTMTGDLTMAEDTSLIFEGATDDGNETTLTVADPTADRTITLPDVTGTVVTTGDTGTVATAMIANDAITNAKIANDQIDSEHYVDGSIDTQHIADAQITTAKIADNQVTTAKIVDANITTAKIAADAVNGTKIADDSINSEHYVDGSIDTQHIADNQITTAKLVDNNVTADKLAHTSVTAGTYSAADITVDAQGRLTAASSGVIATSEITDGAVTTAKINDDAVTTAKINDGAVTTATIASSAVTTAKIAADAITNAKIADNAVGVEHIADAELTTLSGMQSGTASKLAAGTTLTSDIADLNQIDGLTKQTTITDSDASFPTSGAVVDYVTAQIAPLGGLEVVATEVAFPNTQPQAGVVISISDAGGVVFNGSGTSTTGRTVGGTTVTINNAPSSLNNETLVAGVGLMVSSTGSGQVYNYHKILGKENDIKQLSDDINDFNARYRVGSSNPTSALDGGDLFFNTTTSKLLVYNNTNTAWEEAQSIGNFFISTLSPAFDGSTQDFTITNAPTNVQQILLSINGVIQKPNAGTSTPSEGFALSGSTIKLAAAPASGDTYFAIVMGSTVNIGTPSNNTVSTAIIQNGAVTGEKISTNLDLIDNKKIRFGTGNDYEIFHDGTKSRIHSASHAISIRSGGIFGVFNGDGTEEMILATPDGAVELYHDDVKRFETTAGGATVNGVLNVTSHLDMNDSDMIKLGDSDDLLIYHNGTDSYVQDNGTGKLVLSTNGDRIDFYDNANSVSLAKFITGGAAELYHSGTKKFETSSNGVTTSGVHLIENPNSTAYNGAASQGGARLTIHNTDNSTSDTFADITFICHTTSQGQARIGMELPSVNNSDLFFVTENNNSLSERMRIQSNGEVAMHSGAAPTDALANLHVQNDTFRVSNDSDGADTTYLKIHAHTEATDSDRWSIGYISNSLDQWAIRKDGTSYFGGSVNSGRTRNDATSPINTFHHGAYSLAAYSGCTDDTTLYRNSIFIRAWDQGDNGDRNIMYYTDSGSDTTGVDYDLHQKFGIKADGAVNSGGNIFAGRVESDEATPNSVYNSANGTCFIAYPGTTAQQSQLRARTSDANSEYTIYIDSGAGLNFKLSSSGRLYRDNTTEYSPADYAEMFEWKDGNTSSEIRTGITVVLEDEMIRPATSSDDTSKIIGVVSANPVIIGDAAPLSYKDKHLKDAYGGWVYDNGTEMLVWNKFGTDFIDGKKVPHAQPDPTDPNCNPDYSIPVADIETEKAKGNVPQAAIDQNIRMTVKNRLRNPNYDPDKTYVPRMDRKEWDAIGLLGKLVVRRGQPVGANWILMKSNVGVDPTDNSIVLDKYLVR